MCFLEKNYGLLMMKIHRSYFKYNALLHMLNGYKVSGKEH